MPINPRYNANLGGEISGPQYLSNPSDAGASGAGIAAIGRGIADLGSALLEQKKAREKTENDLLIHTTQEKLKTIADDAEKNALISGKENGEDWVDLFDSYYSEKSGDVLAELSEKPKILAEVNIKKEAVRNLSRGRISDGSTKAFLKYGETQYAEALNIASANVRKNPYKHDDELLSIKNLVSKSLMTDGVKEKVIKNTEKSLAEAAVNGFVQAGDYEAAKKSLNTKFAGLYSTEEQDKKYKDIVNADLLEQKRNLQASDRIEKESLKIRAQRLESNFEVKLKELEAIMTIEDPDQRQRELKEFKGQITQAASYDELEDKHLNRLLSLTTGKSNESSGAALSEVWEKVDTMGVKELEQLRHKVGDMGLTDDDKIKALNRINQEIKERTRWKKGAPKNKDIATYRQLLKDDFKVTGIFASSASKAQLARALEEYDDLVAKKVSPDKAADQVRASFKGQAFPKLTDSDRTQIRNAQTHEDLDTIGKEAAKKFKRKEYTPKDMETIIRLIKLKKQKLGK
jgi:hypothetical protein